MFNSRGSKKKHRVNKPSNSSVNQSKNKIDIITKLEKRSSVKSEKEILSPIIRNQRDSLLLKDFFKPSELLFRESQKES